jgi:hypothetical protein
VLTDGSGVGSHTYTYQWDAESRLTSVDNGSTASYTYNALDERVEKNVSSSYTESLYDQAGAEVGTYNRTAWTQSVVSLGDRHVAHYQNSATYFTHADVAGSTSQVTDNTGSVAQDQLFYPFGQSWSTVGSTQETRFAGLPHRDTETNLDGSGAATFSSTQGRSLSPGAAAMGPLTEALYDADSSVRYSGVSGIAEITGTLGEWAPAYDTFLKDQQKYLDYWRDWAKSRR